MKVSRISAITLIVLLLIVGICSSQNTGEYPREGVQHDSEARFEEEYIEQIKQLVKGLEYSDKVAEDFVQMVSGWKDAQGRPVLTLWKQRLNQARQDYKQGRISKEQLAKAEENITRELSQRIQKEINYNEKFFDLIDVIKNKQAGCLGYSQLVCLLGNSIGLSVEAIDVEKPMTGAFPAEPAHTASIVSLTDGKMMMVDLVPAGFVSKPFIIKKEFAKVGNYWELKDEDNPLGIHRRIQIFDRNGLIAAIYNERGVIYGKSGQYQKAISYLAKAIELNPKYALAYYNRGTANHKLGQYTQAISDYTKAIELNPKYAVAYNNRGVAYYDLGQYTQAISDYTRAIELNSEFAEAYYNRGVVYYDLGQHPKAISDYTKAIELNPKYAEAYNNRGIVYYDLGQHPKAISDYTKAIELNPKYAVAYNNRGNAYYGLGQYPKAISDYTRVIELNPEFALAYYNRGLAYAFLGKFEEAKKDLFKAVELNPALKTHVKKASDHFKLNLKLE
jgi:tetratricopeptide (TPR) repeat protein